MSINDQYSDEEYAFARSFARHGTLCSILCDCGRTYFVSCPGHGDYEEGELEELTALAEKEPDKYFASYLYDSIDWASIGGKQIVIQCQCGLAKKYIGWLEAYAEELVDYLKIRYEQKTGILQRSLDDSRRRASILADVEKSRDPKHFAGSGI